MRTFFVLLFCAALAIPTQAGTVYSVTAADGEGDQVTYEVKFGGGKLFEQHTAYDLASGKFVYVSWNRGDVEPKVAAEILDHATGRTIKLYDFPGADQPLPIIPSIKEMTFCPKTGDKNYQSKPIIAYD